MIVSYTDFCWQERILVLLLFRGGIDDDNVSLVADVEFSAGGGVEEAIASARGSMD